MPNKYGLVMMLVWTSIRRAANAVRLVMVLALGLPLLAACTGADGGFITSSGLFKESKYGVSASPRVSSAKRPPKGGGRYMVGKPYTVAGKRYVPEDNPSYEAVGMASWYGSDFHGRLTANGEIYDQFALTAAHPTMPLPSYARVTNLENGRSVVVRVNDRGPYHDNRVIDVSAKAAEMLAFQQKGVIKVHVDYVGPAPLEGDDTPMLLASLNAPLPMEQGGTSRVASLAGLIKGAFAYAEEHQSVSTGALAAADALANGELVTEDGPRSVSLLLGVFVELQKSHEIAQAFAMLGAVIEQEDMLRGVPATRVMLTYLKPGVTRQDVRDMAKSLGLGDVVLY